MRNIKNHYLFYLILRIIFMYVTITANSIPVSLWPFMFPLNYNLFTNISLKLILNSQMITNLSKIILVLRHKIFLLSRHWNSCNLWFTNIDPKFFFWMHNIYYESFSCWYFSTKYYALLVFLASQIYNKLTQNNFYQCSHLYISFAITKVFTSIYQPTSKTYF